MAYKDYKGATPDKLASVNFSATKKKKKEGYDMREVDAFLDELEGDVKFLIENLVSAEATSETLRIELENAYKQAREYKDALDEARGAAVAEEEFVSEGAPVIAPVTISTPADEASNSIAAAKILERASQTADEVLEWAEKEAQEIVAKAQEEHDEIESRLKASRESLEEDVSAQRKKAFDELNEDKRALESSVSEMRKLHADVYGDLKHYIDEVEERVNAAAHLDARDDLAIEDAQVAEEATEAALAVVTVSDVETDSVPEDAEESFEEVAQDTQDDDTETIEVVEVETSEDVEVEEAVEGALIDEEADEALHQKIAEIATSQPLWKTHIEEISKIENGWVTPDSEAPTKEVIDAVTKICERADRDHIVIPGIFPHVDGGAALEWRGGSRHVELDVLNTGYTHAYAYDAGPEDNNFEEVFGNDNIDDVLSFVVLHTNAAFEVPEITTAADVLAEDQEAKD